MIRGLDLFREHFADYRKSFVLIGGVACHEWLATQGLEFRVTKDMDMVLIVEALDAAFVKRFWEFIEAGKYKGRYKAEDGRQLYRFEEPEDEKYPETIEIFSRKPSNIDLAEGQHIVPVKLDEDSASLSAILLNDDYYELVRQQHNEEKDLPLANPAALIPLKARACLDFMERTAKGEKGKGWEIAKHRTDVFRIAATLPNLRTLGNKTFKTCSKSIHEYLVLLSVCQTCKYKGVDFLEFVRLGKRGLLCGQFSSLVCTRSRFDGTIDELFEPLKTNKKSRSIRVMVDAD